MNRRLWWVACALVGISACAAEPSGVGFSGGSGGAGGFGGLAGASGTGAAGVAGSAGTGGWAGSAAGWGGVGGGLGGYGGYGGDAGAGGDAGTGGSAGDNCIPGQFCMPQNPDTDDCGSLTLNAEVEEEIIEEITPGNIVLIFDRSGSMNNDWNGTPRWQAAGDAMVSALTPIADSLTIGAILFPSPPSGGGQMCASNDWLCILGLGSVSICGVNPIASADQMTFQPGPAALLQLSGPPPKYQPVAGGGTPTTDGVRRADEALNAAQLTGTTAAVIITDGAPNCGWDQNATLNIITAWAARGIRTYVVGLPGSSGGGNNLTALATAGGTAPYLTPTDSTQLQQQMAAIVSSTVTVNRTVSFNSCSITLNPAAEVVDDLQLVVVQNGAELGVDRNLGAGGGWSVSSDGTQVEIFGELCEEAKRGRFTSIKFKYGCVNLPPLPPPTPPE